MKVALYARVSTEGQDPEVQLAALRSHAAQRGWEIVEEFIDRGYSGAKERRPALDRMMEAAWVGKFEAAVVWRFDRFARSVKHLIEALENFRSLKIHFISLQEQFDTSTPIGHAMFTIIGAMAQLERDIIRERVKAGLDRARAKGVRLGRGLFRSGDRASRSEALPSGDRPEATVQPVHCPAAFERGTDWMTTAYSPACFRKRKPLPTWEFPTGPCGISAFEETSSLFASESES